MKRIGMGIVGAGFVGPHHVDAVRRLGFVDVVAVAGSSEASAKAKAEALGAAKAYGSYEALLDDPDVQVVHNATPNYLHYPVNAAAIAKGKHVVSDKPLAMTAAEAKTLLDAANKAGIVHAVTFNYRGNPLVQQARPQSRVATSASRISSSASICRTGCSRTPITRGGWSPTRAARRPRSATSGRTGAISRSTSAGCASPKCSATSPRSFRSARSRAARAKRSRPAAATSRSTSSTSRSKISRRCCCGSTTARGALLGRPGLRRAQERLDSGNLRLQELAALAAGAPERALARPSRQGQRDPAEGPVTHRRRGARLRASPGRPPGVLDRRVRQPDARYLRVHRRGKKPSDPHPPAFATFEDGYRANCIVEAILESAKKGSVWTKVNY